MTTRLAEVIKAEVIEAAIERSIIIMAGILWLVAPYLFDFDRPSTIILNVGGVLLLLVGGYSIWKFNIRRLPEIEE